MRPSNGVSHETGSSPVTTTPTGFLQSEVLRLYFSTLEPWVSGSVSLPSCSSQLICVPMWDHPVNQPVPCWGSSLLHLSVSTLPSSLDECFFFNSFVAGLLYSSILGQFWLFFVFKLVINLILVDHTYLCLHLDWKT